jgi:hypothetical protein
MERLDGFVKRVAEYLEAFDVNRFVILINYIKQPNRFFKFVGFCFISSVILKLCALKEISA